MFGKRDDKQGVGQIETLLGAGTVIDGNVRFSGGLRIDGEVKGNVVAVENSHSLLVLSEQSRVEGDVEVGHVVCNGTVVGKVFAANLLELQSKARVVGDVTYGAIEMQQGAVIEGRLELSTAKVKEQTPEVSA